jgi:hypothetical protein
VLHDHTSARVGGSYPSLTGVGRAPPDTAIRAGDCHLATLIAALGIRQPAPRAPGSSTPGPASGCSRSGCIAKGGISSSRSMATGTGVRRST